MSGGGMSIEMWRAEDDDATLLERGVVAEFGFEPCLDSSEIRIAVFEGVVTLAGLVPSYAEKLAAERAAKRVPGVQAVENELLVALAASDRRTDLELARAATQILKSDVTTCQARVEVTVYRGWIDLTGQVQRDAERRRAGELVSQLVGVTGLTNRVTLNPVATPAGLEDTVEQAIEHCARLQKSHISVETHAGTVRLRGRVRCLADQEEIEKTAWSVPGVAEVEDEMDVKKG
jgi:osmotically-inducible protein OsmY